MEKELVSRAELKQTLEEYRKFAFGTSMINTCLAFALGAAFGKIINSLVNNLVMPIVNYSINVTGTDWRAVVYTPVPGIKLEIGSFIGASIDFFIITVVCYLVWKIAKHYAAPPDPPPT